MFVNGALAADWKKLDPDSSVISVDLDWPWVSPEQGSYFEAWSDDYGIHSAVAFWSTESSVLYVVVNRLAEGHYWQSGSNPAKDLRRWLEAFNDTKVVGAESLDCAADVCLKFSMDGRDCAAFDLTKGTVGKRFQGDAQSRLIRGWLCADHYYTATHLQDILNTIEIRGRDSD